MDEALLICRFVQFSAAMLLFGWAVFTGLLMPAELRDRLARPARWTTPGLALLIAITTVLWLGLEAGEAGDGWPDTVSPDALAAVLTATSFGHVWAWRLVIVAVLLGTLVLRPAVRRLATIAVSAAVLASLALVGHAAMQDGVAGLVHRLNHALHLLSAGFWIGCLPPLLICLRQIGVASSQGAAIVALKRFSGIGHFAVALVLATGIVNARLILSAPWLDLSSPYRQLLAIKIGLVCTMVLIAIVNRYVIVPRLANNGLRASRAMVIGTVSELGLGAIVIALVSVFGTLDPI